MISVQKLKQFSDTKQDLWSKNKTFAYLSTKGKMYLLIEVVILVDLYDKNMFNLKVFNPGWITIDDMNYVDIATLYQTITGSMYPSQF